MNRVEVCRENSNLIGTASFHADYGAHECAVFAVLFFLFAVVAFTALTSQSLFCKLTLVFSTSRPEWPTVMCNDDHVVHAN